MRTKNSPKVAKNDTVRVLRPTLRSVITSSVTVGLEKLSERPRTPLQRSPTVCRKAAFRPILSSVYPAKLMVEALLDPLFGRFLHDVRRRVFRKRSFSVQTSPVTVSRCCEWWQTCTAFCAGRASQKLSVRSSFPCSRAENLRKLEIC